MYLASIRSSRLKNRLYLSFSDNFVLPFFIDDYVLLKLKKGQEINQALFQQLIGKSVNYQLKNYALRQLGLSPKTKKIITQKLLAYLNTVIIKYQLPISLIDKNTLVLEVVDYLETNKFLNESAYVDYFIKKNIKKPRRFLEYHLKTNGINVSSYAQLLPESDTETDNVKSLIAKKYLLSELSDYQNKNKIIAALYRKGFPLSAIKAAIDDILKSR